MTVEEKLGRPTSIGHTRLANTRVEDFSEDFVVAWCGNGPVVLEDDFAA